MASVALSQLPAQGIETYQLIRQGGPFLFGKDGVVFGNRERLLPVEKRGYTANTRSKHRVPQAGAHVELCAVAQPLHRIHVTTRPITTRAFARLCRESDLSLLRKRSGNGYATSNS